MFAILFLYTQVYKEASSRDDLEATIELLEKTSILVKNFQDQRPVRSVNDVRLNQNKDLLSWFKGWKEDTTDKDKFITRECYEDMVSLLVGFSSLVELKLSNCALGYIKPFLINSDVVENLFCSQRGICNGSTTNPTYLQYSKGINTIIIGQPLKSRKSNAASQKVISGALPYKTHVNKSFKSLRM
jgi:hypothetical protein